MNSKDYQKLIITGKKLYDQVSRCYRYPVQFILTENAHSLQLILRDSLGAILLLDLTLFDDNIDHPMVSTILKKGFEQRIIVITDEQDSAKLYHLLEQGVRGYCHSSINDELLAKAIRTVDYGELWIGRQFISYVISKMMRDQIGKGMVAGSASLKGASLTPREEQIANHVAHGKCDKLIARELNISPNTVKNHLSNIFKKLQVTDRFQLALMFHGVISH